MKRMVAFVIICFVGASCTNRLKLMGSVAQENYKEQIPFNFQENFIVVEVEIEGKSYQLAIDTGADFNVFDNSLRDAFSYKKKGKIDIESTTSLVNDILTVIVPEISIGEIDFQKTGAVFMDLSAIKRFVGCSDIDGLIGNNLMRKANWKIDYKNEIVEITNNASFFNYSNDAHILKMNANKYGGVYIPVTIGGETIDYKIDTGYSGAIKSNDERLKDNYPHITRSGITGANASGIELNKEYLALVDELRIADVFLRDARVSIDEEASLLIGNEFYKYFNLLIDWEQDLFILEPVREISANNLTVFEVSISPNYDNNHLEVISAYKEGDLYNEFEPGTKILSIDGYNTADFTKEELCFYWQNTAEKWVDQEQLSIEVLDKNGDTRTYNIQRLQDTNK